MKRLVIDITDGRSITVTRIWGQAVAMARARPPDPPATSSVEVLPAPVNADTFISDAQVRRLRAVARDAGWSEGDLNAWLIAQGIGSPTKIKRDEYAAVVSMLQRAAP